MKPSEQTYQFLERLPEVEITQSLVLPKVKRALPDFRGISAQALSEDRRYLFLNRPPTSRGAPRALQVSARVVGDDKQIYYGHRAVYDCLLPETAGLWELVTTNTWLEDVSVINTLLRQFQFVQLRGGKHVGPVVLPGAITQQSSAQAYDGYDATADAIEMAVIHSAFNQPELLLDATCRGFQLVIALLLQLPPEEIGGHRPSKSGGKLLHPVQNIYRKLYHSPPSVQLLGNFRVNSNHAQGYRLATVQPKLQQLRKLGWYVTHVSGDNLELVEQMVRVQKGRITAVARQFHPERMESIEGQVYRDWLRRLYALTLL